MPQIANANASGHGGLQQQQQNRQIVRLQQVVPTSEQGSLMGSTNQLIGPRPDQTEFHSPKAFDIWALGITVAIGGQYFAFNQGFSAGFGSFAVAIFLTGVAYICLISTISEITSTLPFPGGAYGLARCTLGFYPGFLIGCLDWIKYTCYVSCSVISAGRLVSFIFNTAQDYEPIYWFLIYLSAGLLIFYGNDSFWHCSIFISLASLVIILTYLISMASLVNVNSYAQFPQDRLHSEYENPYFVGGVFEFMHVLPIASWLFIGIESLGFACDLTLAPKKNIPLGAMFSMSTLFFTGILVSFVVGCQPPGIEATLGSRFPISDGLAMSLKLSSQVAHLLSLPAVFGTAFGFLFASGKTCVSLAKSKLLPQLIVSLPKANLFCMVLGFSICLLIHFLPNWEAHIYNIAVLSAYLSYLSQCFGYWVMKTKFRNFHREYVSPVGVYGAIFAAFIFSFGIIAILGFQKDHQEPLTSVIVLIVVLTVYYINFCRKSQTLSPEEQAVFMEAHAKARQISGARRQRGLSLRTEVQQSVVAAYNELSSSISSSLLASAEAIRANTSMRKKNSPSVLPDSSSKHSTSMSRSVLINNNNNNNNNNNMVNPAGEMSVSRRWIPMVDYDTVGDEMCPPLTGITGMPLPVTLPHPAAINCIRPACATKPPDLLLDIKENDIE